MNTPLEQLLADFDESAELPLASTLPGTWYTDPRVHELEKRAVFEATWQLVGRERQVEAPGQFLTAIVGGEPIVVVRGADGVLRAFFNVCRHHAAEVVTEPAGCKERLRCPYHGWTYALDGKLVATPEFDGVRAFDRADHGLVPVHVAVFLGLVFVHLDPDPMPLEASLGGMAADLQTLGLPTLEFAGRREWTLQCNWKVFVDNFLDGGYHVPFLHKSLNTVLDFQAYAIETHERGCLQSSPASDANGGRTGRARYFWIYPNLMLNAYDGYVDTNLVVPFGVDRVKVVFDFYCASKDEDVQRAWIDSSASIQDEDLAICESVQRGLASRAYRRGRLSVRREAGENLFHKLLATSLRRAARLAP
jgi:choline monooxygenase